MAFGPYDPTANFFKTAKEKTEKNPRRYFKPISDKKKKEKNPIYEKAKRQWRKIRQALDGFRCQVVRDGVRCERKAARNPHHIRGRLGKLLWDIKNFLAACQRCHDYIHANPTWAEDAGYIVREYKTQP